MKKLLLTLIMVISVGSLHGMEKEIQQSMTLPQLYYRFSHDLLLPEIAQHIFFLHCGDSNLAELEQNCKSPELLVKYIETLIDSCGDTLATEVCECFFKHKKISICEIQDNYKNTCLHWSNSPNVTQILLKIAGDDKDKLLTMQNIGGSTALASHTDFNRTEMVKVFLNAAGSNAYKLIAIRNLNTGAALHFAIFNENIGLIKLLLDSVSDKAYELIAMQKTDNGWTTLHSAIYKDQVEIVKLLLNAVGNKAQDLIMIQNNKKQTVLDWENNLPEINEILQTYMTNNKST